MSKKQYVQKPALKGSISLSVKVAPLGISLSCFATSKCRHPTIETSLIFSMWSPT